MSHPLHKSCFTMSALLMQYICRALLKSLLMYILAHKPLHCTAITSGSVLVTLNLWRWDNKREILPTCRFSLWHHTACKVSCQQLARALACESNYSTTIVQTLFHGPSGRRNINTFRVNIPEQSRRWHRDKPSGPFSFNGSVLEDTFSELQH